MKRLLTLMTTAVLLSPAVMAQSAPDAQQTPDTRQILRQVHETDAPIGTATGSETSGKTGGEDNNAIELYSGEQLQAQSTLGRPLLLQADGQGVYWVSRDNGQSWHSAHQGVYSVIQPNGNPASVVVH